MKPLILASASPRRKEILSLLNIPFQVIPADIEENVLTIKDISRAAEEKAQAVLIKNPDSVVIGADTVVVVNNEILGKPQNLAEAKIMLKKLSNKTHFVYTGVSILAEGIKESRLIATQVFVKKLEEQELDEYIQTENILDAAGAYKIQGSFAKFIEKIEGDYLNIVGFPLNWVYEKLKTRQLI